jgi:hypothetical protein
MVAKELPVDEGLDKMAEDIDTKLKEAGPPANSWHAVRGS